MIIQHNIGVQKTKQETWNSYKEITGLVRTLVRMNVSAEWLDLNRMTHMLE